MTKAQLLEDGVGLMLQWCKLNNVKPPAVSEYLGKPEFYTVCAYYRDSMIHIWTNACSPIGMYGRLWSYPGYTVDRTPYGVIAHELGHHVDRAHGRAGGDLRKAVAGEDSSQADLELLRQRQRMVRGDVPRVRHQP